MLYAYKPFIGDVIRVKSEGKIYTYNGDIPVFPGDLIFQALNGEQRIIMETEFNQGCLPVEVVEKEKAKTKVNYNEMAQAYSELGGWVGNEDEQYINGTKEIASNKGY